MNSYSFCTYLYADPKTNIWRYVGEGLADRPFKHLHSKTNNRLYNMLQKRKREGFNPQPIIIPALSKEDAEEMEMLLIAMIGRENIRTGTLFNLTDGGGAGISGYKHTTKAKCAIGVAVTSRYAVPGAREATRIAAKAVWNENKRAEHSVTLTAHWAKPGEKEAQSIRQLARWARPGEKEAQCARQKIIQNRPELKLKQSVRMSKLYWWNNGKINKRLVECPPGWIRGRLPYAKKDL
jgi:hypothetical protein